MSRRYFSGVTHLKSFFVIVTIHFYRFYLYLVDGVLLYNCVKSPEELVGDGWKSVKKRGSRGLE